MHIEEIKEAYKQKEITLDQAWDMLVMKHGFTYKEAIAYLLE